MIDIRSKRAASAGSEVNPTAPSPGSVAPLNDSAEEAANVIERVLPPPEEPLAEATPTSPEKPSVSPTPSSSTVDAPDLEPPVPAADNPELSKTDPSPELKVQSVPDSVEPAASTETEIGPTEIEVVDEQPFSPAPIIRENSAPVPQSAKEYPTQTTPVSLKDPLYQPPTDREPHAPHPNRSKGAIETIEELCQQSLHGINSLIRRSNERETEAIRQLESDLALSEQQILGLTSERDRLLTDCNDWNTAYETLQGQLKNSGPYQRIFSQSLPAWLSLENLTSLLNLPSDDGTEFHIDPKIVWRIMPAYINLVDELKSGTLAPRQLASATDAFSEAVCVLFEGDDQQVTNWHENANAYLKPAGYSFMILAVGAQIDNDLVTGSIQGKTTIGTIKRMPLIKDGGDVIRKADVIGV